MKRRLGPKGQVVIPKEIREKLQLSEGSNLTFEVSDDTILVRAEPSPDEAVDRFLAVRGKKRQKLVDWRTILEEEYKMPGR